MLVPDFRKFFGSNLVDYFGFLEDFGCCTLSNLSFDLSFKRFVDLYFIKISQLSNQFSAEDWKLKLLDFATPKLSTRPISRPFPINFKQLANIFHLQQAYRCHKR